MCSEEFIKKFFIPTNPMIYDFFYRLNVGVQPPPKAVGWNDGLDRTAWALHSPSVQASRSAGWLTPSLVGTSPSKNGFTPSRQPTL